MGYVECYSSLRGTKQSRLIALFIIIATSTSLFAQSGDSVKVKHKDTAKVKHLHPYPIPVKAMVLSAIIPGGGQFYNKSYWKIPIVYVGLGVAAYFIITNQQYYNTYYSALNNTTSQDYILYGPSELSTIIDYYHRNRDISVIAAAAVYILQIVDANVDAQLHGFNVSDDISFHLSPTLTPNPFSGAYSLGAGVTLKYKL